MELSVEQVASIQNLFGHTPHPTEEGDFEVRYDRYGNLKFTADTLFQLCEILDCTPDELFWNPDLDYSGCYYDGETPEQILIFVVHKI